MQIDRVAFCFTAATAKRVQKRARAATRCRRCHRRRLRRRCRFITHNQMNDIIAHINATASTRGGYEPTLVAGVDDADANATTTTAVASGCVSEYEPYEPMEMWLLGVIALPFIIIGLQLEANCRISPTQQLQD